MGESTGRIDSTRTDDWCRRYGVAFTRSRAWKVNDSAHVEQKRHVYALARLHVNFLQRVQKRVTKTRLPEVFSWRLGGSYAGDASCDPLRVRATVRHPLSNV